MFFIRLFTIFICVYLLTLICIAQPHVQIRAMRGVWISSVNNIDFPSNRMLTSKEQQAEFVNILDSLKALNFNAVFVQIRPAADAFYYSAYEGWSEWLSGEQGVTPIPFYDPLEFMVKEAHARNIEFHAWFNPFRVSTNRKSELFEGHIIHRKPHWLVEYGAARYLDPGLPEVRQFVCKVVLDVVQRYDIDGVHLDDYFYPYPEKNTVFKDSLTFSLYKSTLYKYQTPDSLAEWRRANIDNLIMQMSVGIKKSKPYIKFGISPFAVWRSKVKDPRGTNTQTGATCYDDLHADIRGWLEKGWIDYVLPQIYFSHELKAAPFGMLCEWWRNNAFGKHVYIGHAVYKMGDIQAANKDSAWLKPHEMPEQIQKASKSTQGSVFYRWQHLNKNQMRIKDSLRVLFAEPALMPLMPWLNTPTIPQPAFISLQGCKSGVLLEVPAMPSSDMRWTYHLYRYEGIVSEMPALKAEKYLACFSSETNLFLDNSVMPNKAYTYVLVISDRLGRHSEAAMSTFVYKKRFRK
ncbi:MAG: glycoside hydrolase [Cytophagales bacterium]|nr:MAG: glycoside hydrolase [Cytophagales bacterium]TAF59262.1 MAG: glycoside hydrolase [Cytophagales bacterium]